MIRAILITIFCIPVWAVSQSLDPTTYLNGLPKDYLPKGIDDGAALIQRGQIDAGLSKISETRLKWKHPVHPDRVLILIGLANLKSGDKDKARQTFNDAVAERPSNSDALYFRGVLSEAPEDREKRINDLTDSIWFNRFTIVHSEDAYNLLAAALVDDNKNPQAISILEKGAGLYPTSQPLRKKLAQLYLTAGRKPEALSQLRIALQQDPANSDTKAQLAETLLSGVNRQFDKTDIVEARRLSNEAAASDIAGHASQILIRSLIESGDLDEAAKKLNLALKAAPTDENLAKLAKQIDIERIAVITPTPVIVNGKKTS